jgi:hypothetical protein
MEGQRMQIDVGGIVAKCFSCGNDDFVVLWPRPDQPADKLACAECCTEVLYDDLLAQIARAAIAGKLVSSLTARRAYRSADYE